MTSVGRAITVALLALLAAGCAGTSPFGGPVSPEAQPRSAQRTRPPVNLSGFSVPFREGYMDGCESGRDRMRRNEGRYKTDLDYTMGWNDGYSGCRR